MVPKILLRVEECCTWCRRPVSQCATAACDDAGTYSGILLRGRWESVDGTRRADALDEGAELAGR